MPPTQPPASASIDVGTIRTRFNWEWAMDADNGVEQDTYWWWARSIRVDPNEVIADDDEGGLWSIPFTTDGADEVTFGTPVRVRETYVPIEGDGVAATAAVTRRRQRVAAAALTRPSKPASPAHPRASTGPQGQEEQHMDYTTLRAEHGIAEDVTDDDIAEVLSALAADDEDESTQTETSEDTSSTETEVEEPAAASATEAENAALRATVDRLAAQEATRAAREAAETRENVLSSAVRAGRITPHERTSVWEPFYDANPAAATEQLSKLPANRHHVAEVGHAGGADTPEATAFDARRNRMTGRTTSKES